MDELEEAVSTVIDALVQSGMKRSHALANAPGILDRVRDVSSVSDTEAAAVISEVLLFCEERGMLNRPFTGSERRALTHDEASPRELRFTLSEDDE